MQLVVPARNEISRLPLTLTRLRAHVQANPQLGPIEVIVVDNASTDGTADAARDLGSTIMPVRVVRCETLGKGAAVAYGIALTTADVVGFMDADGATDLAALADSLALIASGVDVAIASRALPGAITNERHRSVRVQGARVYRRATQSIARGVYDTQCGFKVFRGDVGRALFAQLRCQGFSFDVEIIARAQRAGARVYEFPVAWYDVPGSTFHPFKHGGPAFWELVVMSVRLRRSPRQIPGFGSPSAGLLTAADG